MRKGDIATGLKAHSSSDIDLVNSSFEDVMFGSNEKISRVTFVAFPSVIVFETWFSPNHISSNRIPLLIKMFELIGNNQKTEKLQNVGKTV